MRKLPPRASIWIGLRLAVRYCIIGLCNIGIVIVGIFIVGIFITPGSSGRAYGQSAPAARAEPAVPEKAGKQLHALRITGVVPRIDGQLDDDVWRLAQSIDDLVQNEPDNMMPPTERTVVQVAYDDRSIYVAVHCFMRDPSQIATGLGRRDNVPPSDLIRITFDPRHDHLTAYAFDTNPSGVQSDYTWFDDTRQNSDYDAVWDVRTLITSDGWTAEFRIPFSQMRFSVPPAGGMVWGFGVRRDLYRRGEFDRWVPTPRGAQGFVSRLGHLVFDARLDPPRRLELLPFATTGRESSSAGSDVTANAGFDLRRGLGPSTTLSATVNPDFAQVELDPAVLNLSVFETFFPEKRPFFLEDSRTFVLNYSQFPLFHSRRIGQTPGRFALPSGDRLISKPDQTTILGAAKVTGKASGWTYGGLTALTSREYALVETTTVASTGESVTGRTERLIEPRTSYSVGRVQRDILGGSSNVGAIGTAVVREQSTDAFTGGVDYNIRWKQNRYTWDGHWVGTRAPFGSELRTGFGGMTRFNYNGKYLSVNGATDHFGRDFRNTDLGFLNGRNNKTRLEGGFNLNHPDPWKALRSTSTFFDANWERSGDGVVFNKYVVGGANIQFRNFWGLNVNTGHNFDRLDDLDTRGGPPIARPANNFFNASVGTDSRKRWQLFVNGSGQRDDAGGWGTTFGPNLRLQPSARLQTSLSTNYQHGRDVAQWITNVDTDGDGVTDNVYGRLARDVLSVTARTTYAFNRNLTFEAYLQPFAAVGAYSDIRRLARPSSFEFTPVGIPFNPDFNSKSLRGNMVLRWEYRPGSTVFLVWNMSTQDSSRAGVFSPLRDLGTAFGADGTHVLMIKMNYWLGL